MSPIPTHRTPLPLVALALGLALADVLLQVTLFGVTGHLFLAAGGAALGVLWLARRVAMSLGDDLAGLVWMRPVGPRTSALAAVVGGAALVPAGLLAGWSTALRPPPPEWLESLAALLPRGVGATVVALIATAVAAPIAEEIVFRGLLYRAMRAPWGPAPAAILSALLFGLSHGEPWSLFGLIGLGLLYAALTELSGSIVPAILAHGLHNAFNLALMMHEGGAGLSAGEAAPGTPWAAATVSTVVLAAALHAVARARAR